MKKLLSDIPIGFDGAARDNEVPHAWPAAPADHPMVDASRAVSERLPEIPPRRRGFSRGGDRLRLIAWNIVGAGCLIVAHSRQPQMDSLFAGPSGPVEWISLLCGIAGLWLVPSIWLSAVFVRTGAGLPAWMGTRIATTLLWYTLAGPIIHHLGQGALVTTRGLVIATVAATAAVSLGVALGLSPWPTNRWLRILLPATVGAICAQGAIMVAMRVWTVDMNYAHIRRLDWLIVLAGAALVTGGSLSRVTLSPKWSARNILVALIFAGVTVSTVAALQVANSRWSPQQRMPSALGIEQFLSPAGADIAFVLVAIGPDGPRYIREAEFVARDESGRTVPVKTRIVGADGVAGQAMLLVNLPQAGRTMLCGNDRSAKLTLQDRASGVHVQALVPTRWCAG